MQRCEKDSMSKYLTTGRSTRYNKNDQLNESAYARATPLFHDKSGSSDTIESSNEFQQSVQLVGAFNYTEHDLRRFSAMAKFPSHSNRRKRTEHGVWESCQFTDQDDAGFKQLQHELVAIADSKR